MHEAYWLSGDQGGTDQNAKSRITWVYRIIHKTWQWSRTVCARTKHFVLIWNPDHWQLDANRKNQSTCYKNDESNHYEPKRITWIDTTTPADRLLTFTGIMLDTFTWYYMNDIKWHQLDGWNQMVLNDIHWTDGIKWNQSN
jgi:hypothetical protein